MHFSIKKGYKGRIYLFTVMIIIFLAAGVIIYRIDKLYSMRVMAYATNIGTKIINQAVTNILEKNPQIDGFTQLYHNSDNEVTAAENNTVLMNKFKSEVTCEIQTLIENQPMQIVEIPLGNVFGVSILNNRGISIPVRLAPVSSIKTDFYEEIQSCGINNTNHSLSIKVEMELHMLSYFSQQTQNVTTTVPVSETLIAGEVPAYFSGGGNLGYIPENIR